MVGSERAVGARPDYFSGRLAVSISRRAYIKNWRTFSRVKAVRRFGLLTGTGQAQVIECEPAPVSDYSKPNLLKA